MATKIKICGLKTKEDIEKINGLEIDYIGFVFAPSKRRISPVKAKALREDLSRKIKTVGIFLDEEIDKVNEVAQYCCLDIVQLHGRETQSYCSKIVKPVWKALPIASLEDVNKHENYPNVSGILLDTFIQGVPGGSGKTFSWNVAKDLSKKRFTILAGGLSPNNVAKAIHVVNPHVVDVSSGVELDGIKNLEKIQEFIRSVKEYG